MRWGGYTSTITHNMSKDHQETFYLLQDEIYRLFLSAYAYQNKLENFENRIKDKSREFVLEEVTSLRLISNQLILQICRLDDRGSGKWTFHELKKEIFSKPGDESHKKAINKKLKQFRSDINDLKVKHRNKYIAHRYSDDYPEMFEIPDLRSDFLPVIEDAVHIFEMLWGDEVSFGFKLGSLEGIIDFKEKLGIKKLEDV